MGQQRAPRGTPTGRVDCSARGGGAGRFSRSVRGPVGDKSRDGRGEQHPPPPLPSRVTQSRRRGHLQHHLLELLLDQVERVPHVRPHRSAGYLRPGRQPLLGSPHSGASSPRTPGERSLGGRVRAHRKGSTSPPRARSAWGLARICAGSRVGWQLPRAFCARGRAEDPGMPASSRSWVFLGGLCKRSWLGRAPTRPRFPPWSSSWLPTDRNELYLASHTFIRGRFSGGIQREGRKQTGRALGGLSQRPLGWGFVRFLSRDRKRVTMQEQKPR